MAVNRNPLTYAFFVDTLRVRVYKGCTEGGNTMASSWKVAAELRKLAEHLEALPETEIPKPQLRMYFQDKVQMTNALSVLPRPLKKDYPSNPGEYESITISHLTDDLAIEVWGFQGRVCELVRPAVPAVYKCAPLLSLDEVE
jgi:hypothetical protein